MNRRLSLPLPLPLLLLLPLLLPVSASAEVNVITLKHRNAEVLLPLLQPVLDEGIRISGKGSTLIINSKPWQLEEIRPLIEKLDAPLHSLMISVKQGGDEKHSALQGSVSGTIDEPRVRVYGTQKKEREAISQQLRVIEGQWATIRAGQAIPIVKQTSSQSAYGSSVQHSIEYKDVESGFEVRPRLSGEQVILDIRPFRSRPSKQGGGIIEQQNISTTVSGKLGEWITVGGMGEQRHYSGSGTIYATGKQHNLGQNVRLKVEKLNN